ncbi:MAG: hypothetical protein NTW19_17485 [Planctomycetota bacterium]|nr:hypothetical protein [Planctomycetota bacterium]
MVLSSGRQRCVVAAIDYCYLCGKSQRRFEEALGSAANIPASRVALQSNHTHDVPLIDEEAHAVIQELSPQSPPVHDEAYFSRVLADAANAVRTALTGPGTTLAGLALGEHAVEQFASNRRVIDAQGKCHVRWSVTRDAAVRDQPEGRIDPMLRQAVMFDPAGKPFLAAMFYTSHPQVSDGRRRVSGDTIGLALDLFQAHEPNVFPLYFTGCAGDITAGKYTTPDRVRNRHVFGVRLYDGVRGAFAKAATPQPVDGFTWHEQIIQLPLALIPQSAADLEAAVRGPEMAVGGKYLAAMKLDRIRRGIHTYPFRVVRLALGPVDMLFLPSELLIEYQFFARSLSPRPVLVSAYGDSFLKYIAYDAAFDEGGYEIEPGWTEITKGVEGPIKDAIKSVFKA